MNANSKNNFYGRDFLVTRDVLTPRPETEQLIDIVKSLAGLPILKGVKPEKRVLPETPVVLDVGTGSGCIAITIKKELEDAKVYAVDISEKALAVAKENASIHEAPITLIISHLLDKVKDGTIPTPDMIVANLPYVDEAWPWLDKEALKSDPDIALYAEDHGLALIKELIKESSDLKVPYLILESDPCQHEVIKKYASSYNYELARTSGFVQLFLLRVSL